MEDNVLLVRPVRDDVKYLVWARYSLLLMYEIKMHTPIDRWGSSVKLNRSLIVWLPFVV
jgi:hypothetical protein